MHAIRSTAPTGVSLPRVFRSGCSRSRTKLKAARVLLPFDGECEGSKNADLTIAFDEGESLKGHSQYLKEASTVLKTAIEDYSVFNTLQVEDDRRSSWVMLLNLIHPGRNFAGAESADSEQLDEMEGYAALAKKYKIPCLNSFVDSALSQAVNIAGSYWTIDKLWTNYDRSPADELQTNDDRSPDEPSFLEQSSRIAAKFGLEATKEAHISCISKFLARLEASDELADNKPRSVGSVLAKYVHSVAMEKDLEYTHELSQAALQRLCL